MKGGLKEELITLWNRSFNQMNYKVLFLKIKEKNQFCFAVEVVLCSAAEESESKWGRGA